MSNFRHRVGGVLTQTAHAELCFTKSTRTTCAAFPLIHVTNQGQYIKGGGSNTKYVKLKRHRPLLT